MMFHCDHIYDTLALTDEPPTSTSTSQSSRLWATYDLAMAMAILDAEPPPLSLYSPAGSFLPSSRPTTAVSNERRMNHFPPKGICPFQPTNGSASSLSGYPQPVVVAFNHDINPTPSFQKQPPTNNQLSVLWIPKKPVVVVVGSQTNSVGAGELQ